MDEQFSYGSDIAPIEGKYFGSYKSQLSRPRTQQTATADTSTRQSRTREHFTALDKSGLSDTQRMRYKMQALSFTDQLEERQTKRQKDELDLTIANQRVEQNRMSITAARDKSKREREANGQIEDLVKRFKGIRDNPDLTDSQRRVLINDTAMENASAIANSPTVSSLFNTASNSYDYKIQEDRAKRAEMDRLIAPLLSNGMTSAAKKLIGEENIDPEMQKRLDTADAVKQFKDEEAEREYNVKARADYKEEQEGLNKEVRTATIARLNRIEDSIKTLEYGDGDIDDKGEVLRGEDPTKLSAKGAQQLKDAASKLGLDKGDYKIDLDKVKPLELLKIVQRSLIDQREKFSIHANQSGEFVLPTFHQRLPENEKGGNWK